VSDCPPQETVPLNVENTHLELLKNDLTLAKANADRLQLSVVASLIGMALLAMDKTMPCSARAEKIPH
jgi:hypothetical protein